MIDAIATRARDGQKTACSDLAWAILRFGLARPALHRYLIGDADIQDAEQATLVAVALRVGSWRGEGRFTTWLHQVASNEARQLIRSQSRRPTQRFADDATEPELFVQRVSSMLADANAVRDAVEGLPDNYRAVVELREFDGLTYDEIASSLDLPINTVKTHLRRARLELAERLAATYRTE